MQGELADFCNLILEILGFLDRRHGAAPVVRSTGLTTFPKPAMSLG
jgi:hypothetical protein